MNKKRKLLTDVYPCTPHPGAFLIKKRAVWRDCVHQVRFLQKYPKLTAYSLKIYSSGATHGLNIITVHTKWYFNVLLARVEAVTCTFNSKHPSEFAGVTDVAIILWAKKWIAIMKIIWHFWQHWYRFKRHHCVLSNCSFPKLTCQNVLIAALTWYHRATTRGWTRDYRASLKADLTFGNQSPVTGLIGLQICTLASLKASAQHSEGKALLNTHFVFPFGFLWPFALWSWSGDRFALFRSHFEKQN